MKIKSKEDYEIALKRFKEIFHSNSCAYDLSEGNELFKAIEEYEKKKEEESKEL